MNKVYGATGMTLLLGAMLACGTPQPAVAGVDVGINVNLGPPPIMVPEPPAVVLVPRSDVYFVPGVDFEVFFYNGYWWSPRGDRWYRSRAYGGPWRVIERRMIPGPVYRVPRDYRTRYVRERRVPYGQWKKERRHHEEKVRQEHREQQGGGHDRDDFRDRGERGEHGRGHGR